MLLPSLMWQKTALCVVRLVLVGYLLALCCLTVSMLRDWIAEPPKSPTVARVQTIPKTTILNWQASPGISPTLLQTITNTTNWKMCCPTAQVNTEDAHHWGNLDHYLRRRQQQD